MKKYLIFTFLLASSAALLAQVPSSFNYQAIARNAGGAVIADQEMNFEISIVKGDPLGEVVYTEQHTENTNRFGMVTLQIGTGNVLTGDFSSIEWGDDAYFLLIEVNDVLMGATQLLSVPYALYARTAEEGGTGDDWGTQTVESDATLDGDGTSAIPLKIAQQGATTGQVLKWDGSGWSPNHDDTGAAVWSNNGSDIYYNSGNVGLGTTTPQADLHINGEDGFLIQSTYGSGTAQNLGQGIRMHFYPKKGAFRAGYALGSKWDDANIGDYSIALGSAVKASGNSSIAMGSFAEATGYESVALGTARATGTNATAMGNSSTGSGNAATAMGFCTTASGDFSTAMGDWTKASGRFSTALGRSIEAAGENSVAIGLDLLSGTKVTQDHTMAIMGGKVGIGTVAPATVLHVHDRIRIRQDPTYGNLYGEIYHPGSGNGFRINANAGGGWADMHLQTDGTTRIFIESAGNVGIGTTSPSKRLYVNGSAGGTQAWNASDARFKMNIETVTGALEGLLKLRGVTYQWKDQSEDESTGFDNKVHYGVVAQEVEKIFPCLVDNPGITDQMKHVEYNGLIGILIEATKDLKAENDRLRSENSQIINRLEKLENLVSVYVENK